MASAVIGSLRVTLGLDSAQFQDGVAAAQKGLAKFEKMAEKAAKAAAVAAGVAAAAIGTAFAVGVGQAVKRVEQMEAASRRLDKALTNTGNAANTSAKELQSWAEDLERRTGRAAQEVMDIGANLATFGFGEETFLRSIELANDMAAAWGGDLRQNMEGLARALADPEKGLAMLSARGITFTEEGKKMAIELAKNGELIKAQAVLMEELEEQVKGVAAEGYQGLDKALGNLRMSYEGFFDTIASGSGIQNVLAAGAQTLGKVFEGLKAQAELLSPALKKISDKLVEIITNKENVEAFVSALVSGFKWIVEETMRGITTLENFGAILRQIGALAVNIISGDWQGVKDSWNGFGEVIEANRKRIEDTEAAIKSLWETSADDRVKNAFAAFDPANDNRPERTAFGEGEPKGLSDAEQKKLDREREMMEARFARLQEMFMSEEELERTHYEKRLEELQKFQDARIASDEEVAELRAKIEEDYADRVARIQEERLNSFASTLGSAGSIIESLTKIMGKEGDKQLGIVKALSLAEALINVYTGITAALRLPFPQNMAAAAAVAAKGFSVIASMRSTSKGSSSGSAGAGGGSGAGTTTASAGAQESSGPSRELIVSGIRPDQLYTGDVLRNLMDALVEKQNDGYKLVTLAA